MLAQGVGFCKELSTDDSSMGQMPFQDYTVDSLGLQYLNRYVLKFPQNLKMYNIFLYF